MRKKVAIYCDHWQNGGVENYIINQITNWNLEKYECTLVTAETTTDKYDKVLEYLGVKHVVLLDTIYKSPIVRILKTRGVCKHFFKNNNFDIAYFNLSNSVSMIFAKYARKYGIKKRIVHSHCSQMQNGTDKLIKQIGQNWAKKVFTNYATDWWACSDKAAEYLFSHSVINKVVYIPNAIDIKKFVFSEEKRKNIRTKLKLDDNDILVGTVGRCEKVKNQLFLLKVMKKLVMDNSQKYFLILVGDGSLLNELKKMAMKLGIFNNCIFYGETKRVPDLLCGMDIFCLPSFSEGNPVSAIEAQICELPCVLSDTITQSAKIISCTTFAPIEGNVAVDVWAEQIRKAKRTIGENDKKLIEKYDITKSATWVQSLLG